MMWRVVDHLVGERQSRKRMSLLGGAGSVPPGSLAGTPSEVEDAGHRDMAEGEKRVSRECEQEDLVIVWSTHDTS
jgi:hypothetical protein